MAHPDTVLCQLDKQIFLDLVLIVLLISGCENRNETRKLTLTRVRILTTVSNNHFTDADSTVSLMVVRVSMSASSTVE